MYPPAYNRMREGFSLLELLIVILIVGIVLLLGFEGVEFEKKKPKALTPLNLKETILASKPPNQHLTLLCLNQCKECLMRSGLGGDYEPYSNAIDLSNMKAYTVDQSDSLVRIEYERYDDKPICLQMDFYRNGSSTQIILQDEEKSYFLPAYFGEAKVFDSPEDAKEYWLRDSRLVSDNGAFY